MIDINCGNHILVDIDMTCNNMFEIMMDDFIEPDTFIKFKFTNGGHGAVRKRHVIAFADSEEETV
ncbi:MAG TPA: hypothetical protein DEQ64_04705 [Lachnoclostridium sp.]|nr:hypothetical protein [Lachnoclostridium sp.]